MFKPIKFWVLFLPLMLVWFVTEAECTVKEQWSRTFGGPNNDRASFVQQTSDGGYVIVGATESYGAGRQDFWIVKTDDRGEEEWNETFGGADNDAALCVQQTSDGGYVIAGWTESYGAGGWDVWIIKLK